MRKIINYVTIILIINLSLAQQKLKNCPAPFISQTYFNGIDQYVEVKNPSATESIPYAEYFLALYANGASLNGVPTSSIKIPAMAPQQVMIFKNPAAVTPAYASAIALNQESSFTCDGTNDIVVISKSENTTCYDDRVDFVGNNTSWCYKTSLVRTNCATSYPRIDLFDPEDWVEFSIGEVDNAGAGTFVKTNAVLGRHNDDNLLFTTTGWNDGSSDESNPDRSREEVINASYSTAVNGSFEACSLDVNSILTITDSKYVSIQTSLNTTNGITNVNNNGALVMVKDQFHNVVGKDLTTGNVGVTRTTAGLDAVTDYVYWSSPIDDTILNTNNSVNNLFPSPPFITSRFYEYINANFQDKPNYFSYGSNTCTSCSYANGYDDNLDDYHILDAGQRAQQMKPGLGYLTWAKSVCGSGSGCNYDINFNGKPNNGVISVPVYHNAPSNTYTNLVGNPYPSAIDLDKFFAVNAGLIDPVAYVWGRQDDNPSALNPGPYPLSYTQDNYLIYNPTMMVIPNSIGNGVFNQQPNGTSIGTLASCQSFFVQTTSNAGTLVFNNSMRTKRTNNTFAKTTVTENKNKLWLNLENNNIKSQVGIAFLDSATDKYDNEEDVKRIMSSTLNIYTQTTNFDLVIDAQHTFNVNKQIPLGINGVLKNEIYTLKIDKITGEIKNKTVFLEDKLLNKIHNLTNEDYFFTSDILTDNNRFVIIFKYEKSIIKEKVSLEEIQQTFLNQCWSEIASTSEHTLGIRADGTLWGWGFNNNFQLGNNITCDLYGDCKNQMLLSNETTWTKVATGYRNSFAIKNDGTIWGWGNNNGSLGNGSSSIENEPLPIQLNNTTNWVDVKTFATSSLALKQDGTLWSWGGNSFGQLGDGTLVFKNYPVQVFNMNNTSKFSNGQTHSLAIKTDGSLWSWGYNNAGQLGNGTTINYSVPVQVGTNNNWIDVSAGWNYTLAVKSDGTLWSWGENYSGRLGNGTSSTGNIIPIQVGTDANWFKVFAGTATSFAIKSNGTLWAWGRNSSYQLCNGTTMNGFVPIQIGTDTNWKSVPSIGISTLALTNDNSIYIWGNNNHGQLGTGDSGTLQYPTLLECLQLEVEQFKNTKITIYPNPSKNTINIASTTPLQKTIIYNLLGAKVYEQAFNESIDISSLSIGVYIVKFYSSDNAVFIEKFIKE